MITFNFRLFIVIFFCSFIVAKPAFSQTLIKVVDQHNYPLANAVITYTAANPSVNKATDDRVYIMDQVNKQFAPHVLIVPVNSLVSFPNSDDIRHHVYSFSAAKTFELKLYAGKPKSPIRFDGQGVVVMGCNIHDSMVGYIYVAANPTTYLSNEKGEVTLTHTLPLNTQLQVWHPNSASSLSEHTVFTIDQTLMNNNNIELVLPVNTPAPTGSFAELTFNEQ